MHRTFLEFLEEAGIAPDLIDFVRRVVDHPEDLYTLPPERQAYWENRIDQVLSMVDVSKEGPASLKGADPMKVQIADDHSKYRSSLRAALERHPEIKKRTKDIRVVRGSMTLAPGVKTDLINATIIAGDDGTDHVATPEIALHGVDDDLAAAA